MRQQKFQWKHMTGGTCYYPEHWSESLWADDIDRMLKAGISVVRIGEFAWNMIEPEEGLFNFDFFRRFLDLCSEKGMGVIFGTPTATPPAWLSENYPEILNCDVDGTPIRHGSRRHYNYNSAVYQKYSTRIVTELAKNYGAHPAIVGWQIDNEFNCETAYFYSESDHLAFRAYLKEKYKCLDALNAAWGTVFWNQTYTDWGQVYGPRKIYGNNYNPSMLLDFYTFISESTRKFCKMQSDILREYIPEGVFITTNGMFNHIDNHKMVDESLDVYTYDSYPSFAFMPGRDPKHSTDLNDRKWNKNLTEVRSICPHFGIMEQQSGGGGSVNSLCGPAPRPGQLTLWAMQSVAQGADYISFFRWRTCTFGTEMYWHGILDYDNRDNRKLAEATDFFTKMRCLDPICGAEYVASFALLKDYENAWDMDIDASHRAIANLSESEIFVASELTHTPYDIVYLHEDTELAQLAKYPAVFYPHPVMMNEARAALLREYVKQGGILIIGCRSGYKDLSGKCVMLPQPGLLQELTGTDIHDFSFTSPAEDDTYALWDGKCVDTKLFNDIITPLDGTKVLARYANSYYKGEAALTEHEYGKGRVFHLGSTFSRGNTRMILEYLGLTEAFKDYIDASEDHDVVMREKDSKKFMFVLNFIPEERSFVLKKKMKLMYDGSEADGKVTLPAFGTAVYEIL